MTDRRQLAEDMAVHLRRVGGAIARGEAAASATMRAYIEGAAVALEAIASDDPVAGLAVLAGSFEV